MVDHQGICAIISWGQLIVGYLLMNYYYKKSK